MGAGALAPGRVCTEFPKDKEFRAFEMLEKIGFSLKPRRCAASRRLVLAPFNDPREWLPFHFTRAGRASFLHQQRRRVLRSLLFGVFIDE